MKKLYLFLAFILAQTSFIFAQKVDFNNYFVDKQLRVDYVRAGNDSVSFVFFTDFKQEPFWGGSKVNLIDTFNYGQYRVRVYDKKSGNLIYTKCYNTLFQEWQDTQEAQMISKNFNEAVVMPYPKDEAVIVFEKVDKHNVFSKEFTINFDPKSIFIKKDLAFNFNVIDLLVNGTSDKKVDIVFLAEGYTQKEKKKFLTDAKNFAEYLFDYEPFKSHKNDFNIRAIFSVSLQSGTDNPGENIWQQTILNSNFWTFGTERYLTTLDYKTVCDVAALAPYDQIVVLVNTSKYGGGGFYNFFSLFAAENNYAKQVLVHEFGHAFGGLADEYWTSDVAVDQFYDLSVEPKEPNITTLVNFSKKWQKMVDNTTPIPTPSTDTYKNKVGAFEGGGYVEKGIYRPTQNCIMKELDYPFCPVCNDAITKIIKFLTD